MKNLFYLLTALLLAPLAAICAADAPAKKTSIRRPNLVFVFSDQQSWDTLGCYGNTQTHTPNLDRLAAKGVRFFCKEFAFTPFTPAAPGTVRTGSGVGERGGLCAKINTDREETNTCK